MQVNNIMRLKKFIVSFLLIFMGIGSAFATGPTGNEPLNTTNSKVAQPTAHPDKPSDARIASPPDEGMWMPFLISQSFDEMRKAGIQLTPEQIYNVNKGSLKDAIVWFGGFCTGEIVSDQGLILTNHHCGYDAIQSHSTVENDILTNGFWAKSTGEEKPVPDLFVKFLNRMEDVTPIVKARVEKGERDIAVFEDLKKQHSENGKYEVEVKPMYFGTDYYMFVYEKYTDIRLVGAPPEAVGKFGGDTDNWMWPRHTGDFSMFRVYSGPDGKPAAYSPNNIPFKPKHHLPVSIKGIKENDFCMIMGYPGRTTRYLTGDIVQMMQEITNPARVKLRDKRLTLWKSEMDKDKVVRLQYASKYARIANYWKYFIGQNKGLKRLRTVEKKRESEAQFMKWVSQSPARGEKYGKAIENVRNAVGEYKKYALASVYFQEAGLAPEIVSFAIQMKAIEKDLDDKTKAAGLKDKLKPMIEEHFKDYYIPADKKVMAALYKYYSEDVPVDQQPDFFKDIRGKYKGNFEKWTEEVFKKSMFADKVKLNAFLNAPSSKVLLKDPAYKTAMAFYEKYLAVIQPAAMAYQSATETNLKAYVQGLREMQPNKKFYPDANSTMRLTFGQVLSYKPMDAVKYDIGTTMKGVYEKEDPNDPEFVVPPRLMELYKNKDFGQYGENGEMPVCFIGNTDITGGNSGSPVINGSGELIGLAFDGNWEAMTGDIVFDQELKRTINVDIRYVLFIIDKYFGASNTIGELTIKR